MLDPCDKLALGQGYPKWQSVRCQQVACGPEQPSLPQPCSGRTGCVPSAVPMPVAQPLTSTAV